MDRFELAVTPSGSEPTIGRWLGALVEIRERTERLVRDLDPALLDWEGPDGTENSASCLLYHVAGVEMGWLWGEIKERTDLPPEVEELFPWGAYEDGSRRLKRVPNIPLSEHLARLERSRAIFLREMKDMSLDEWRRLRPDPQDQEYECTPEWVVFHLVEHEAAHAGQISSLIQRGRRAFGNG